MSVHLDSSWTPAESPRQLLNERTWLAGYALAGFGYGVVTVLTAMCSRSLYRSIQPSNRTQRVVLLVFVAVIFVAASLFIIGTAKMTELSFVTYRLYPGGPAAFEIEMFSLPIDVLAVTPIVFSNWLCDGLLCWRCMVIYSNITYARWLSRVVPLLLYLSEIGMGILWIAQISAPNSSLWSSTVVNTINFTTPYFWIGFSLNILATAAIVGRLLMHRRNISHAMGGNYGLQYVSLAAIIVESALLYSAFLLMFLVPYTMDHPVQNAFLQLFGEAQMIPTLLIVHRVASGEAWSNSLNATGLSTNSDSLNSIRMQPININIAHVEAGPSTPASSFKVGNRVV
ncbi:hypothetical protein HGRIS_003428 [Hohenbuehelia grisea]|uniref:Uncharacterized protein n=1 Tax=Hohenbuehelia grisea TaxID=104357 RepID=A0ABR3JGB8_9AGAR